MVHITEFEPHYDAIIVGARCAGAATAMLLAQAGLRVLAVDRQSYGSDTLSTHALMRPAVMQLSRWGLLQPLIRSGAPVIASTTFHYGEQEVTVPIRSEPDIPGLIAPRRRVLDRMLVDAARAAGATVLHDTPVHDLVFDPHGRVRGVALRDAAAGQTRTVSADRVIGADGLGSFVARKVEARTLVQGRCSVAHVFGYAAAPEFSGYHWYFGRNLSGGIIPTNDGLACIVASVPTDRFDTEFRFDLSAATARPRRAGAQAAIACPRYRRRASEGLPRRARAIAAGVRPRLDAGRRCRLLPRSAYLAWHFRCPARCGRGGDSDPFGSRVRIAGVPGDTRHPRAAHP